MLKKLYLLSFSLFFVLPVIAMCIKLFLRVQSQFVLMDGIVLGVCLVVFGLSSLVVHIRKNKIKRINEKVVPYLLVSAVVLFFAVRLLPRPYTDDKIFGWFDNVWDVRLHLLYGVLLGIVLIQGIAAFFAIKQRQVAVRVLCFPKSYKLLAVVALIDFFVLFVTALVKTMLQRGHGTLDGIVCGALAVMYLYYVGLVWFLNKARVPKNTWAKMAIVVPIVLGLLWVVVLVLPVDFWADKLLYLVLGVSNLGALGIFWHGVSKGNNQQECFE
ncbi:MAG: hypothetical protein FWD76_00010 [Firmicutes bacterium]|nr:hypothetical protein [Bacillota bacterium]